MTDFFFLRDRIDQLVCDLLRIAVHQTYPLDFLDLAEFM